jgi:transcriptional regulator with XRE-family HTH domain
MFGSRARVWAILLAVVKQANGLSGKALAPNLRLVAMPTDADLAQIRARRAYWLRAARANDPRRPTLAAAAKVAGLKEGSGSVVSLWERNATPEGPKDSQLRRLAAFYGLPFSLFSEPPETDEERLARMRQLALAAVELEQQDWDSGEAGHRDAEDGPGDSPGRLSA